MGDLDLPAMLRIALQAGALECQFPIRPDVPDLPGCRDASPPCEPEAPTGRFGAVWLGNGDSGVGFQKSELGFRDSEVGFGKSGDGYRAILARIWHHPGTDTGLS